MLREKFLPYFEGKKITVMGLGLLGRGIGDTAFLAEYAKDVIVTDKKTGEALVSSVEALKKYKNIRYVLGEHRVGDFEGRDFILKAAGVPLDSIYVSHAKALGVSIYMSAALLCHIVMEKLPNVVIIGVTGTRGKSTTTEMIAHILRENGSRVHVAGNVRGAANLPVLAVIEDGDFLVLELDSWQLQGFGDMKISPHISVFTSFLDDHLVYYKNNRELYFNDKANIYRHQEDGDVLIVSPQASEEIIIRDKRQKMIVPEEANFEMRIIGDHNQVAASLAYEVALQCGLDDESIRSKIKNFSGVSGRLENMGLFQDVRVFNDNNATTEDATVASIDAINKAYNQKPIVIVGGVDKGLSTKALSDALIAKTKAVVYLAGSGTDKIPLKKEFVFEKLEDCVRKAFELCYRGDIILFSPGFASFSKYFSNEYERNDLFVKEVHKYTEKKEAIEHHIFE